MIPLIVLRPEPGCSATCEAARAMGLAAHGFPLFAVRPLAWEAPPPESFDALLIGSANALRHGGNALTAYAGKPAYVVGEATAKAARAAGLEVIAIGTGGLQGVLAHLQAGHARLLRLAGQERMDLTLPPGVTMAERLLYASEAQAMPPALAALLAAPALVLLHSAEAARHFADECKAAGIDRSRIRLATLGPRISAAAGDGWASIATAISADDPALLALAAELCQDSDQSKTGQSDSMQDDISPQPFAAARRPGSAKTVLVATLLAFLAGGLLVGWLAWEGKFAALMPEPAPMVAPANLATSSQAGAGSQSATAPQASPVGQALGSVETRLALLEDRLSRIDLQAHAASGNAARAEGLLIAFATRRLIDRGAQLGYLEDQLRLRFADAQPNAVQTVIAAARQPVTLEELASQLEAAGPALSEAPSQEGAWDRMKRELSGLLVIRHETTPSPAPQSRVERARLLLTSGKTEAAIAEVARLPGAAGAQGWIASARRYEAAQRALDLIETTAMLEPHRLQDGSGNPVNQPSPLIAPPATKLAPQP